MNVGSELHPRRYPARSLDFFGKVFVILLLLVSLVLWQQVRISIQVPQIDNAPEADEVVSSNFQPDTSNILSTPHSHPTIPPKPKSPQDSVAASATAPHQISNQTQCKATESNSRSTVHVDHLVLRIRRGECDLASIPPKSIPVVLWPLMDPANSGKAAGKAGTSPDVTHIQENGVMGSSVLTLANESIRTFHPNVVWVTDAKFPYKQWCQRLHEKVLVTQERRKSLGMPAKWPIYVVDFTDTPKYQSCSVLEGALGKDWVWYSKRSTIVNRTWNFDSNWINMGQSLPTITTEGRRYQQTPLIVRTDIVEGVAEYSRVQYNHTVNKSIGMDLAYEDIVDTWKRQVDVAHYWPASTERAKFSNLRNQVSHRLQQTFSQTEYTVFCDMVGMADRVGRRHPQMDYIAAMLDTKIIVVAQRDTYEDQYRLFEAMVSGALVFTDPMLTLPDQLQNGTNIIIYSSLDEMIGQVQYFLEHPSERIAIAKAGLRVALSRHRSWHRMEEIILGRPATTR